MQHLKLLREELGISQKRLGEQLDIGQRSISKYEIGISEPNFKTLRKISVFFNTSIDYLVNDHELDSHESYYQYLSKKEQDFLNEFHKLSDFEQNALLILLKKNRND